MSHRLIRIVAILFTLIASLGAQITVDFPVLQDSWVNSNNTTRNYGSQSTLKIKHANPIRTPYLQFQTFGISGTITSATLNFRFLNDSGTVTAHRANNEGWDESFITYANQPDFSATSTGSASVSSNAWASIPVTTDITGNGLFSFALRSTNINGDVYSKESSFVPYLRVTYLPVNLDPVAQPESYSVLFNTLRTVAAPGVLANDSDPNGDPLTAQLVSNTTGGTLNLASDGSFTYQPNTGFSGTDSFTYRALDDTTGQSSPVTVTLDVLAEGVGQLTTAELDQIQSDLGITLSLDEQIELATLVKPVSSEPWRSAADTRIEQIRKANLNIAVVTGTGNPIPGASVRARLKRKTFHFGGVLDLPEFMNGISGGISATDYRNLALKYFDSVGLNNALKPKQSLYNTANNNTNNLTNTFFPWCEANNIPARGHLLLWPGGTFMSAPVEAKVVEIENTENPTQTQLDELRALVDNEISTWASMWNVYEWDVVNEVLSNHRIQDILGPGEIVRWFQLAQSASAGAGRPDTGRLINEFQIISGNAETNGDTRIGNYQAQIQYLIDNNTPITGIGFQSRFKFRREDPALLYNRLEQFAVYNKDLVGTEFEVIENAPIGFFPTENLRASMTEEIMTTYFSHPKATGFFAWEFANSETRALVTNTGSPRLNALVWYYINRIRYHTDTTLTTDAQGQVSLRGFKGDYEIIVDTGSGSPVTIAQSVNADTSVEIGGSNTITLDVIEDSHAQEGNPDAFAGNSTTLQLRSPNGSNGRVAYLKFDIPQVPGAIQSATLRLHVPAAGPPENGEVNPIQVLAVADSSWSEAALTWNSRPATGAILGSGSLAAGNTPGTLDIDLDPAAITSGGLWSVALNETSDSYGTIASSENTSGYPIPQLILTTTGSTSNHGPTFTTDPIIGVGAIANTLYSGTLAGTATDIDPGDTIHYAKVSGPDWLVVAADGTLSGTPSPSDAGPNTFIVSASDGTDTTTATLNITVSSGEYTLNVIEDSHAQEGSPDATAPNSATLQVRTPNGTLGRVAYLKFDLSQVSGTIQSATLRLHIPPAGAPANGGSNGETDPIEVLAVADSTWAEAGLTWNTRPATGIVLGSGALAAGATPGTLDIVLNPASVTPGGLWSVALNETGSSFGTIASSENTTYPIPQLLITTGGTDTDGDGTPDSLDIDDDNDGIPDDAETAYGMDPLLAADGGGDSDRDGINAIVEHRLGLDPTQPNPLTGSFRIEPAAGGNFTLTIRHRTGAENPAPSLLYWDGLGAWLPIDPGNPPPGVIDVIDSTTISSTDSLGTLETHVHTLQPLVPRLFFRLAFDVP